MADRKVIQLDQYRDLPYYTPGIAYKNWVFASGTIAVDPATGEVAPAVAGNPAIPLAGEDRTFREVRHIYGHLSKVMQAAGGDIQNAVRLDQFSVSSSILDAHHQARRPILHPPRAASTSVEIAALLSPEAQMSIELVGILASPGFEKEGINTDKIPQPLGGYSPAIRAGDFVFVAGQVPTDWKSSIAPEAQVDPGFWTGNRIDREARYILGHTRTTLEAAGSSLENAVKANVYLKHIDDIPRLDHVWREFFPNNPPARTIFPVNGLGATESRIEITIMAVTDHGKTRKEVISSPKCRTPLFHESQAVRAGDILFLSGLMAVDGTGLVAAARGNPNLPYDTDSAAAQMEDILLQAQAICEAAGADLKNALRMLTVHTDLKQHSRTRKVLEGFFTKGMPASSTIGVSKALQVPGTTLMSDIWVAMTD